MDGQSRTEVEATGTEQPARQSAGPTAESSGDGWRSSVQSVAHGAAFDVVGKVLITGLGFLITLLVTQALGVRLYGIYTYGKRLTMTVGMFTNLGSDMSSVKYISANTDDPSKQNLVLGLAYTTTLVVSVAVAAVGYLFAAQINAWTIEDPLFVTVLQLFAIAVPFQAVTMIAISAFRGLERPIEQTLVKLGRPVGVLIGIGGAILAGGTLIGVAAGFAVGAVLVCGFSLALLYTRSSLRPKGRPAVSDLRSFYNFSLPFTFSRAGAILYSRIDVFMIGIFLRSNAVGVYSIAVLIGGILTIPLAGLNQLFPSVTSRLHAEEDYETLQTVYRMVTRWSLTVALAIAAPLVLYRRTVLSVFGPEFVAGATVLVVFACGQLINAAAGPSNDILTMTDHQYLVLVNHWLFGVANVVLNYYLILEFGLIGAAVATASVLAGLNIVRVVEVWILEDLFAYSLSLWKPFASTLAATAVMALLGRTLSGLPLVLGGGTLGLLTFGLSLYGLGIEARDRELAAEYIE